MKKTKEPLWEGTRVKRSKAPRENWKARALKAEEMVRTQTALLRKLRNDRIAELKFGAAPRLAELAKPEPWFWRLLSWWRR